MVTGGRGAVVTGGRDAVVTGGRGAVGLVVGMQW